MQRYGAFAYIPALFVRVFVTTLPSSASFSAHQPLYCYWLLLPHLVLNLTSCLSMVSRIKVGLNQRNRNPCPVLPKTNCRAATSLFLPIPSLPRTRTSRVSIAQSAYFLLLVSISSFPSRVHLIVSVIFQPISSFSTSFISSLPLYPLHYHHVVLEDLGAVCLVYICSFYHFFHCFWPLLHVLACSRICLLRGL